MDRRRFSPFDPGLATISGAQLLKAGLLFLRLHLGLQGTCRAARPEEGRVEGCATTDLLGVISTDLPFAEPRCATSAWVPFHGRGRDGPSRGPAAGLTEEPLSPPVSGWPPPA